MQSKKYLSLQLSSVFDSATRAGQSSFGTFFGVEGKRILHSHVGFSARGEVGFKSLSPSHPEDETVGPWNLCFFQVWFGCFFNLPQIKGKISCLTQNKIMFSLASQPKNAAPSPLWVHVPLPVAPRSFTSPRLEPICWRVYKTRRVQLALSLVQLFCLNSWIFVHILPLVYGRLSTSCLFNLFTCINYSYFILRGFTKHNTDLLYARWSRGFDAAARFPAPVTQKPFVWRCEGYWSENRWTWSPLVPCFHLDSFFGVVTREPGICSMSFRWTSIYRFILYLFFLEKPLAPIVWGSYSGLQWRTDLLTSIHTVLPAPS